MWLVLGLLQLVACTDPVQSVKTTMSKQECHAYIRQSDPQTTAILQCLITHYNLTQLVGQVHEKMDQIERKLREELKNSQSSNQFKKMDDVLDIEEGSNIAHQDCQRQQSIVQAIRRKLEWHNLMNGIDTTYIEFSRINQRSSTNNEVEDPIQLKLRHEESPVLDRIRCNVRMSLKNLDEIRSSNPSLKKDPKTNKDEEENVKRLRSRVGG